MTTPNNQPTPPPGMEILTDYTKPLPERSMRGGNPWMPIPAWEVGKLPWLLVTYAIPITPTVPATGDSARQRVKSGDPEYFCQWCYDHGLRYPDDGLPWRHSNQCPNRPQATGDTTNEKGGEPCRTIQDGPISASSTDGPASEHPVPNVRSKAAVAVQSHDQRQELLPCPFCGSHRIHRAYVRGTGCSTIYMQCGQCNAQGPWSTTEEQLTKWNTRK